MRHKVNFCLLDEYFTARHYDGCIVDVTWSEGSGIGNRTESVHVPADITMLWDAFEYALDEVYEKHDVENLDFKNCDLQELLSI